MIRFIIFYLIALFLFPAHTFAAEKDDNVKKLQQLFMEYDKRLSLLQAQNNRTRDNNTQSVSNTIDPRCDVLYKELSHGFYLRSLFLRVIPYCRHYTMPNKKWGSVPAFPKDNGFVMQDDQKKNSQGGEYAQ